jgi:PAS domain S-box-containing protein
VNEVYEALLGAADGAFVVDEVLQIHIWNEAAEGILGFGNSDVVGQMCYQILQGYDEQRRLICKECCQVAQLTLKGESVPNYEIHARTNFGERRWLNMSILTFKMGENGDKKMIVHLFRDISQKKDGELFFRRILEMAQRYQSIPLEPGDWKDPDHQVDNLTIREREVLTLLARGLSTKEIAEALSISMNTVRNHIQNIFTKLGVHSRPEAIAYAYQKGLIDRNEV